MPTLLIVDASRYTFPPAQFVEFFSYLVPVRVDALDSKLIKLRLALVFKHFFDLYKINKEGALTIIRPLLFKPDVSPLLKAAVIEVVADYYLDDPKALQAYGIHKLVDRSQLRAEFTRIQEFLGEFPAHVDLVVLSGAAYVARELGIPEYLPVSIDATEAMENTTAVISQSSVALLEQTLASDPSLGINIFEDVIDTTATLCTLLETIISTKLTMFTQLGDTIAMATLASLLENIRNLAQKVGEMDALKLSQGSTKAETIAYENLRCEVRDMFSQILERTAYPPCNLNFIIGANKLLDKTENYANLQILSPISFAHNPDGELLTKPELSWLMGMGLDTKVQIEIQSNGEWVAIDVCLGRFLPDIVAMDKECTGELKDVPAYERLQMFVLEICKRKLKLTCRLRTEEA